MARTNLYIPIIPLELLKAIEIANPLAIASAVFFQRCHSSSLFDYVVLYTIMTFRFNI